MPRLPHAPRYCATLLALCVFQALFSASGVAQERESSVDRAFNFLNWQMDRYHRSIVIVGDPEYAAYYPSGWMGDRGALSIERMSAPNPNSGKTGYKISYRSQRATRREVGRHLVSIPGGELEPSTWQKSGRRYRGELLVSCGLRAVCTISHRRKQCAVSIRTGSKPRQRLATLQAYSRQT